MLRSLCNAIKSAHSKLYIYIWFLLNRQMHDICNKLIEIMIWSCAWCYKLSQSKVKDLVLYGIVCILLEMCVFWVYKKHSNLIAIFAALGLKNDATPPFPTKIFAGKKWKKFHTQPSLFIAHYNETVNCVLCASHSVDSPLEWVSVCRGPKCTLFVRYCTQRI